ncbi:MAG: aminotransferase class I/II-fold pyridoxal phosphate-dependent enzyme [bacterium]
MSWASDIKHDERLIKHLGGNSPSNECGEDKWREYESEKAKIWQKLRQEVMVKAAERVKNEFQSPSYSHSLWSEAGRRSGQVWGNINDYTRDQHPMAKKLEDELAREYLTLLRRQGVGALTTSSGMAALTTILIGLARVSKNNGTYFMGKESYFQNHEVVENSTNKIIKFDELDLDKLATLLQKEQPSVVFVDSLCNNPTLTCPDINRIAQLIRKNCVAKTILVVDNSLLGVGVNYEMLWKENKGTCQLIVWESMNKFFQYGLDRTTGGVIWAPKNGKDGLTYWDLFYARVHTGTIMPDFACALIPRQNASLMKAYQARINRNGEILYKKLQKLVDGKKIATVYRGKRDKFSGAQIVVELKNNSVWQIQGVIRKSLFLAKMRGVQLSAGSSFGLPNTRLYLTARKSEFVKSFLRIAVGCESELAIKEIVKVLGAVLS